jgi:hypothetical protein
MTPDEWLLDETRGWVRRASSDLRAAEICASELPAEALYHCQQAAEKLLKAFLTWSQTAFRKTHELRELATACARIDATLVQRLSLPSRSQSTHGNSGIRGRPTSLMQRKRHEAGRSPSKYKKR